MLVLLRKLLTKVGRNGPLQQYSGIPLLFKPDDLTCESVCSFTY